MGVYCCVPFCKSQSGKVMYSLANFQVKKPFEYNGLQISHVKAERKAVNKYYPPEWTPKQGSINKFRGTHALRERARKLHMGILIIRFEMPYNIWCEGCGKHIGMGVRYNAEKTKVGMYYSTPIYKFRMKCHLCTNHFEIQTDPQNLDYVILNGARRQEGRWDPTDNEQVAPDDKDVGKKLALDAMYRLEHGAEDKAKQKVLAPTLARLEEYKEKWKDDYDLNKLLRKKFREKKKSLKAMEEKDNALLAKSSLDLQLLPETTDDVRLAGLLKLNPVESYEKRQQRKREEINSRPLFNTPSKTTLLEDSVYQRKLQSLQQRNIDKHFVANQLGIVKKVTNRDTQLGNAPSTQLQDKCSELKCGDDINKQNEASVTENNPHLEDSQLKTLRNQDSDKRIATECILQDSRQISKRNSLVSFDYDSSLSDDDTL